MSKISSSFSPLVNDVTAPRSTGAQSTPGFFNRLLARFHNRREPAPATAPMYRRYEVMQPPASVVPRTGPSQRTTAAVTTAATSTPAPRKQDGGAAPEEGPGRAEARSVIARWVADADAKDTPLSRSGAIAAEAFQDMSDTLSTIAARPAWKRWLLPTSREAATVVADELAPLTRAVRRELRSALDGELKPLPLIEAKAMTEILRALAARAVTSRELEPTDRKRWHAMLTGALRVDVSRARAFTTEDAMALRITLQALRDAL